MRSTTMAMALAKMMQAETKYEDDDAGDDDGDNNDDDSDDSPMGEPAAGDDRREGFLAPLDAAANIMIDQNLYL